MKENEQEKIQGTAILLAGGNSVRMGKEKAFLEVNNQPLIEYIYIQLFNNFNQVLISANDPDKFLFLDAKIIPDKVPGSGPLMGMASAIEASENDINFIIACDIPVLNMPFIRILIKECRKYDGVVPVNSRSQYEPLYAVYRKSMLPAMNEVLNNGSKKISDVYKFCRIRFYLFDDMSWFVNLNTYQDYEKYINSLIKKSK